MGTYIVGRAERENDFRVHITRFEALIQVVIGSSEDRRESM